MITITHLITSLNTGGAEAMLAKLVSGMDRTQYSNKVICLTPPGPVASRIEASGIPVESLFFKAGRPSISGFFRLVRLLKTSRPDILQTWLYHADLLGTLAGRMAKVPHLAWNIRCSAMDFTNYSPLTRLVTRICARISPLPDMVLTNSHAAQKDHQGLGYRPKRWMVIPNGFDVEQFRPQPEAGLALRTELGIKSDQPLIGLIARFDPQKDHQTFLSSASMIAKDFPMCRFLLCGDGMEPDNRVLRSMIQKQSLEDHVLLLGRRDDIPRVMNALDLLVSASAYGEGFPNVLGEAMACGIPCVATDVGDSSLVIAGVGKVVPPRDPQQLASAVLDTLKLQSDDLAMLKKRAREHVVQHYSLDCIVKQYERLYRSLVGKKPCAA